MELGDLIKHMSPLYNWVILKLHRVEVSSSGIILPGEQQEDKKAGFFEVVAVGNGVSRTDGEPCPVEVGDYVMPLPGRPMPLSHEYFTCQWIELQSIIDKDFAESVKDTRLVKPTVIIN